MHNASMVEQVEATINNEHPNVVNGANDNDNCHDDNGRHNNNDNLDKGRASDDRLNNAEDSNVLNHNNESIVHAPPVDVDEQHINVISDENENVHNSCHQQDEPGCASTSINSIVTSTTQEQQQPSINDDSTATSINSPDVGTNEEGFVTTTSSTFTIDPREASAFRHQHPNTSSSGNSSEHCHHHHHQQQKQQQQQQQLVTTMNETISIENPTTAPLLLQQSVPPPPVIPTAAINTYYPDHQQQQHHPYPYPPYPYQYPQQQQHQPQYQQMANSATTTTATTAVDQAVAYANAAAHVAWAAAQAVQQAVLLQQQQNTSSNIGTIYHPTPPHPAGPVVGTNGQVLSSPQQQQMLLQHTQYSSSSPPPPPLPRSYIAGQHVPSSLPQHAFFGGPHFSPHVVQQTQYHHYQQQQQQPFPPYLPNNLIRISPSDPLPHEGGVIENRYAYANYNEDENETTSTYYINQNKYHENSSDQPNYFQQRQQQNWGDDGIAFNNIGEEQQQQQQRSETSDARWNNYVEQYPRKRQQQTNRLMPIQNISVDQQMNGPLPPLRDKVRRRLRSSDNESSSSGGGGSYNHPYNHHHHHKRHSWNHRLGDTQHGKKVHDSPRTSNCGSARAVTTGGSGGYGLSNGGSYYGTNKKQRAMNDESLVGKTGVAALFEWCSKRRCTPTFTIQKLGHTATPGQIVPTALDDDNEFECIVHLEQPMITGSTVSSITATTSDTELLNQETSVQQRDNDSNCEEGFLHEWGRGRGRNKNAAKQESARRAMQLLIPGIRFDEATGILVALPNSAEISLSTPESSATIFPSPVDVSTATASSMTSSTTKAACNMEDLAPNLAKQLDIGREDPPEPGKADREDPPEPDKAIDGIKSATKSCVDTIKSKNQHATQVKRTLGTYPETSTTSEDEDRSSYYASRGASVCSVLLHTIIQIDKKRIPDGPTFTYELSPTIAASSVVSKPHEIDAPNKESSGDVKRKYTPSNGSNSTNTKLPVARFLRGSFKCTAKLRILSVSPENGNLEGDKNDEKCKKESGNGNDELVKETVLEAEGMGGTKRDARHVASAKLLSLLFPECQDDMAKVKAAAQLMRDQYAANRAKKHHHQQQQHASSKKYRRLDPDTVEQVDVERKTAVVSSDLDQQSSTNLVFAHAKADEMPLPSHMIEYQAAMADRSTLPNRSNVHSPTTETPGGENDEITDQDLKSEAAFRQLSRQKQMDYIVESALQNFNDLDDERGIDDVVGRTMLRRAEPTDLQRIKRLLEINTPGKHFYRSARQDKTKTKRNPSEKVNSVGSKNSLLELSCTLADVTILDEEGPVKVDQVNTDETERDSAFPRLWSSSSIIVLLLCRAISAYDDPPLGCAVLSYVFSSEKGKMLRLIQMGSESHLPQERFLDCIQSFASCLNCVFEIEKDEKYDEQHRMYSTNDLRSIVESYTKRNREEYHVDNNGSRLSEAIEVIDDNICIASGKRFQQLRPVQEESEISDEDDSVASSGSQAEANLILSPTNLSSKPPRSVKPSKRSRFK